MPLVCALAVLVQVGVFGGRADASSIDRAADLSITLSDSSDPVDVGEGFSYTLAINNSGPDHAPSLKVVEHLPSAFRFDSAATSASGSCSQQSNGDVFCGGFPPHPPGSSTITIKVTALRPGTFTTTASVDANSNDVNAGNNTDSEVTTVTGTPVDDDDDGDDDEEEPAPPPESPCQAAAPGVPRDVGTSLALIPAAVQIEEHLRRRRKDEGDSEKPSKKRLSRRARVVVIGAALLLVGGAAAIALLMSAGGEGGYATLHVNAGRVDIKEPGAAYRDAATGARLDVGDFVRTGRTGHARVDYPDGSLTRLDVNTTFKVERIDMKSDRKRIDSRLSSGRIWNRVEKLTQPGDRFSVKTVTSVAQVRGTTFVTDRRSGSETTHITIIHAIDVLTEAGETGTVDAGSCRTEAGEDLNNCRFTPQQIADDPFIKDSAHLDATEKGDDIDLSRLFHSDIAEPVGDEPVVTPKKKNVVPGPPEVRPPASTVTQNAEPEAEASNPVPREVPRDDNPCSQQAASRSSASTNGALVLVALVLVMGWLRPRRRA